MALTTNEAILSKLLRRTDLALENTVGVRATLDAKEIPYAIPGDGTVLVHRAHLSDALAVLIVALIGGQTAAGDALIEGARLRRLAELAEREATLAAEQVAIDAEQAELSA